MKNVKKLIACGTVMVMLLGLFVVPVSAAGNSWPFSSPCDELPGVIGNGDEDSGIIVDPTVSNPEPEEEVNKVLRLQAKPSIPKNPDIRVTMEYTSSAIQYDFDFYRTAAAGLLEIRLNANDSGSNGGTAAELLSLENANLRAGGTGGTVLTTYQANQWYSLRIRTNKAKTLSQIWLKKREEAEYSLIGTVTHTNLTDQDFASSAMLYWIRTRNTDAPTYLDNFSWTEISGDVKTGVHYDFNDVQTKTGGLYGLAINTNNMKYEQATFDGAQVLKSTMNETSGKEAFTWEDVPDMEKVVVSVRMGMDSEGDAGANLPYQFGIRPVFAEANGTKGPDARNNMSEGIRLAYSRYFMLEGTAVKKDGSDELTTQGAFVRDGKLYDAGYVYDRQNKIFKAYIISDNGETAVVDASSNTYVQGERYLAGIKLYSRSNSEGGLDYFTGKGYYDYIYVDEADDFIFKGITLANNTTEVKPDAEIRVEYNYVIDPKLDGVQVELKDSNGGANIDVTVSTYNGKYLIVKPNKRLAYDTAYNVTVTGVKDLLGQTADMSTVAFTTASPVVNEASIVLDGGTYTATAYLQNAIMIIAGYGEDNALMAIAITDKSEDTSASITGEFENVKVFIFDSFGSLRPLNAVKSYGD